MKLFILVVILGLAGGYYFYQQKQEQKQSEAKASSSLAMSSKPSYIECEHCGGLGKLVDSSSVTHVGYRCPICKGNGKILEKEAQSACPYCKGFGRVPMNQSSSMSSSKGSSASSINSRPTSARMIAQRCPICRGSGFSPKTPH